MALRGTLVFSSGKSGDYDIWTLSLETEELKQLTSGECWNDQPCWSPDGSRVVYVSNKTGVPELWCMNEDGTGQTQITKESKFHRGPSWTPDGGSIICSANYDNPDEIDIWMIDARGSGKRERLLAYPGMETEASISPDGKKLLFSSPRGGNYDLWEMNLDSGQARQLTKGHSRDYAGSYSPDGEWIAYVSQPGIGQAADIWLVDSKLTKEPVQMTHNKGTDEDVSWSPDGKYLVYCASGSHQNLEFGERLARELLLRSRCARRRSGCSD